MNKKALAIGQVFIFIVAAITFALIMIFGYKAISGFISSGEDVAFVQFKTSLETSVKKIYTEFGAVRVEQFQAPTKYTQICFVNMDFQGEMEGLKEFSLTAYDTYDTAKSDYNRKDELNRPDLSSAYAASDQNVFLKPAATAPIKIHQIKLEEKQADNKVEEVGFLCEPIRQGSFTIVLEGKGSYTLLSKAE